MTSTATELIRDRGLGRLVQQRDVNLVGIAAPQAIARDQVRRVLTGRTSAERIDDAVLVADELVGNALQHAGGPVSLALDVYERGVSVGVADRGTDVEAVPTTATSDPWRAALGGEVEPGDLDIDAIPEEGRGMFLIALLAAAWTVDRTDNGKVVRVVLSLSDGDQ